VFCGLTSAGFWPETTKKPTGRSSVTGALPGAALADRNHWSRLAWRHCASWSAAGPVSCGAFPQHGSLVPCGLHGELGVSSFGRRRYATADQSRNNVWVALITLGEGWHNNHHRYQSSTNQGFSGGRSTSATTSSSCSDAWGWCGTSASRPATSSRLIPENERNRW